MTVGSTEVTSSEGAGSAGAGAEKVTAVVFDVGETLVDVLAVHVRRGPWGVLHDPSAADARIESLDQLAEAFA